MELGQKISTKYGEGTIIGYDLKGSRSERIIVKIDTVIPMKALNDLNKKDGLCFFKHEVTPLTKGE